MSATQTRTIFITGAASGIGRETARLFSEKGWRVGLYDLDAQGLESLAAELPGETVHAVLDVRDPEAYRSCVDSFSAAFGGRMDVLFNCAGIMRMGPFGEVPLDQHLLTLDVNCRGVLIGAHVCLDLLAATPDSCILSMCSASAIYGVPELSSYSASKFFVRGFTESLNLELEKQDIRVTDLMPSYVATPMVSGQTYEAGTLKSLGAKLSPEEIAQLAYKAAAGRQVHWLPGVLVNVLNYAGAVFPFLSRPTMKLLNRS